MRKQGGVGVRLYLRKGAGGQPMTAAVEPDTIPRGGWVLRLGWADDESDVVVQMTDEQAREVARALTTALGDIPG